MAKDQRKIKQNVSEIEKKIGIKVDKNNIYNIFMFCSNREKDVDIEV